MKQILFYSVAWSLLLACLWGCDVYERTGVEATIYVDQNPLDLFTGEVVRLTASPTANTSYTWSSDDPAVASVSDGLVEAIGEGVTFIIVSDGTAETKVQVTVETRISLTGIVLDEVSLELSPDDATTVNVFLIPEGANDLPGSSSWTSEDTGVAVVDESGTITAIAEGQTCIIYREGSFADTVVVYVSDTRPFNGPHTFSAASPCLIYAADFDFGGEGYAFHDSDSGNSIGNDDYRQGGGDTNSYPVEVEGDGADIGYTNAGEWLLYTVVVQDAGDYMAEVSLSAASDGGQFRLEADGIDVTGPINVPNNGSWSDWRWLEAAAPVAISLSSGRHHLKFYFERAGYNLRALRFTKK